MTLFAGELDGAVSVGRRAAQRQAEVLRRPGPVRRLRREGAVEHDPVRPPDVRRGHRAPRAPGAAERDDDTVGRSRGLFVDRRTTRTSRSSPQRGERTWYEADAGIRPPVPADHGQPAGAATCGARRHGRAPETRCSPPTAPSSAGSDTGDRIVADFDAAFSRPTLDNAAGEPEAVNSVAAFPTRLAGVTTASDSNGLVGPDGVAQRQKLVLIPGQFLATRPRGGYAARSRCTTRWRGTSTTRTRRTGLHPRSARSARTPLAGETHGRCLRQPDDDRRASTASSPCTRPAATGSAVDLTADGGTFIGLAGRSGSDRQRADPCRRPSRRRRRQRGVGCQQGPRLRPTPPPPPGPPSS